jgi:dTMP kinase
MNQLSGKFIILDGGEGCGKSTQIRLLQASLRERGHDVLLAREPGSTLIGEKIRAMLLDPDHSEMSMRCEMLLYMAARAQLMHETILPALEAGKTIICDRFVSSTLAYQLGGDGLRAEDIKSVANMAIKSRWPDLTLLLDLPPQLALQRVQRQRDRIEQRPIEYHERVRQNFLAQAQSDPDHYRIIPADGSPETVHARIFQTLEKWLA